MRVAVSGIDSQGQRNSGVGHPDDVRIGVARERHFADSEIHCVESCR